MKIIWKNDEKMQKNIKKYKNINNSMLTNVDLCCNVLERQK